MAKKSAETVSTVVQLSRAEFFELVAKDRQIQLLKVHAKDALAAVTAAEADAASFFQGLADVHGFNPRDRYRPEESTCSLVPVGQV